MPDILDANGLRVKDVNTIISELNTAFRNIYGQDINLDQNSPDGQIINIFAQSAVDIRELATQVYNSFNPDRATGRVLDERVTINNISRRGGTFTTQPISVTVDRTVTLSGLDAQAASVDGTGYTVQDDAGNQFILLDSTTIAAGTHSLNFRAANIGRVETTVNTITNPVTIVLGVTTVNNPLGALQVGQNEETDAELRIRRQQSVGINSTGFLDGIVGEILNLTGVTDARLEENFTNSPDANGTPAHAIWLIVEGGANTDIANVIYRNKTPGTNMRGNVSVTISRQNGSSFVAQFDRPTANALHVRFDMQPTVSGATFDENVIKQAILDNVTYRIGEFAETSRLTCAVRDAITANGYNFAAINMEISMNGTDYADFLEVQSPDRQWVLDASRITITEV